MKFTAIIPARAASTRLPNKPLLDIGGKPMVVRTAEQAKKSQAGQVVVATDDPAIAHAVQVHGIDVVLTRPDHPTGTDRLAEATGLLGLGPDDIVVNVQGDEPLIDPDLVNAVAATLACSPQAAIATCAAPVAGLDSLFNPNHVKVVCDVDGYALYFSRAPIPWARDAWAAGVGNLPDGHPALHHIGLYAYRVSFLQQYPRLGAGQLERTESLEQLRAMEHGYRIIVHRCPHHPAPGVDTPDDLARVRRMVINRL